MIKGLMGNGGVVVSGGNTSMPYVSMSSGPSGNPLQGMLRINGNDMQVFDGGSWVNISTSYATVELTGETQAILQWAREERDKQAKRQRLVESNAALKKAWEAIKRAEANFDIIEKFVENDPIEERTDAF